MKRTDANILKVRDNDVLFGKNNQDTCFVYKIQEDGKMKFSHVSDSSISSFLKYVDTSFINIIQKCIPLIANKDKASFEEVADLLTELNPIELEKQYARIYYVNLMSKFAAQVAACSDIFLIDAGDFYQLIKLQHGDSFVSYYPIQLKQPFVLMPYCTLSAHKQNNYFGDECQKYTKVKLIVTYNDRIAPTNLGIASSNVLASISPNTDSM